MAEFYVKFPAAKVRILSELSKILGDVCNLRNRDSNSQPELNAGAKSLYGEIIESTLNHNILWSIKNMATIYRFLLTEDLGFCSVCSTAERQGE